MSEFRTLKQLSDLYKAMYRDAVETPKISLEIIGIYLSQEEVPLKDVIDLLSGVVQTRAANQDRIIRRFRSEGLLTYDYYFANYAHNIAIILSQCTRKIIASMELTDHDYDTLKTIADICELKNPFYLELLNKMHEHGIYFKNEEKPGETDG